MRSNVNGSFGQFQTFSLLLFFYEKILYAPKAQKAQKRNQVKVQKRK